MRALFRYSRYGFAAAALLALATLPGSGAVSVFVLKRFSHWHFIIETALLAGAAAIVFALLADPAYLFLFPARFGVELLYVELAAFLSLGVLMLVYGPPQNETRRA